MDKKTFKNDNKTIEGRFKDGDPGGPGRPKGQKNYLTLLEDALKVEAKKAGITYWERLAQYAYTHPVMALGILKKFIPDMQITEHIDREPKIVIFKDYEAEEAGDNGNGDGGNIGDIHLVKGKPKED